MRAGEAGPAGPGWGGRAGREGHSGQRLGPFLGFHLGVWEPVEGRWGCGLSKGSINQHIGVPVPQTSQVFAFCSSMSVFLMLRPRSSVWAANSLCWTRLESQKPPAPAGHPGLSGLLSREGQFPFAQGRHRDKHLRVTCGVFGLRKQGPHILGAAGSGPRTHPFGGLQPEAEA